jgi:DNA-binding beta-propeller fold protein YncE
MSTLRNSAMLWLLVAPAVLSAQEPKETGTKLKGARQLVDDLAMTTIDVAAKEMAPALCWGDAQARVVFTLEKNGLVRRITVPEFQETHQLDIGSRSEWLSMSGQGLLATVSGAQQVWVLDPQTLKVKKKLTAPTATQAVSAPKLQVAYVTNGKQLAILDLVKGKLGAGIKGEFESLAVTANGAYLLTGSDKITRSKIGKTGAIKFEEAGPAVASGRRGSGLMVSGDGEWVALPTGGGNITGLPLHPPVKNYPTFVYPVKNLKKPDFALELGGYPEIVGFDPVAKLVYAQNADSPLIVCTTTGAVQKQHRLKNVRAPRQYLVHPAGRKMLLLSESQLAWIEWK